MKWLDRGYRRCLVDMHIDDWHDDFMTQFDPKEYIDTIAKAKVQGVMIYAQSHVGLCNWPTRYGQMHKGLKQRDIVNDTFQYAHYLGMDVILYYSLIFDNWAYQNHPEWRIQNVHGRMSREGNWLGKRYGWCCPNSEGYRDYTIKQIKDFCSHHDFESVFFDMTFWPEVCCCESCKEKFREHTNKEIPMVVDWNNSLWVEFQRLREEWLSEFAMLATNVVKQVKPESTVTHNWANMLHYWKFGTHNSFTSASDYGSGDFYHGTTEGSFICKYLYNTIGNYEYLTSRCTGLDDHTTSKPMEQIETSAFIALANKGAFMFIDAIDPIGTLNPAVYEMLGKVNTKIEKYEAYVGGQLRQDTAVYLSLSSKINLQDNGRGIEDESFSFASPHVQAAVNVSRMLKEKHIPYGVISIKNIEKLKSYRLIILPDVIFMSNEEIVAFEQYVFNGGKLYVSGGRAARHFGDMLGLTYIDETKEKITYAAPCGRGRAFMPSFSERHPLAVRGRQAMVTSKDDVEVLATITLPYTDPEEDRFASIHSNPPGVPTDYPALTFRKYGKGSVVWSAGAIESVNTNTHIDVMENVTKFLEPGPYSFSVQAHKSIEVTVFDQDEHDRILVNVVNTMEIFPHVPIDGIVVKVDLKGKRAATAKALPDSRNLQVQVEDGYAVFQVPSTETFQMIEIMTK